MNRRRPTLGTAALATALLLSLTACGGDDGDGDTSESAPVAQSGESPATADTPADTPANDAADDAGPAGGVIFVDVSDAAAVVEIGPDGFDPGDASVAVGDVVEFSAADDGIYGVIVGDLDGYTVTSGIDEYFRFDAPGSYAVTEDVSSASMTVTVE